VTIQSPPVLPPADACCAPLLRQPITPAQAADLARLLKALADPTRLQLVSMVAASDGGEACVCDLTGPLGLTQPTISHHLKILVNAGIFTRDKRGVWSHYSSSSQPWTPCLQCSAPHAEPGVADEIDIAKAEAVDPQTETMAITQG